MKKETHLRNIITRVQLFILQACSYIVESGYKFSVKWNFVVPNNEY